MDNIDVETKMLKWCMKKLAECAKIEKRKQKFVINKHTSEFWCEVKFRMLDIARIMFLLGKRKRLSETELCKPDLKKL